MTSAPRAMLATLVLGLAMGGCGDAPPSGSDPSTSQAPVATQTDRLVDTAEVPRLALTTLSEGKSGPPLVLVPGLASGTDVWDGTVTALGDDHTIHLVQLAGFADAVPSPGGQDPDDYLETLSDALIDSLDAQGIERPVLVGHSLGGALGLAAASRHPDALSGLVVVDALPFYTTLLAPDATRKDGVAMAESWVARMSAMSDATYAAVQRQGALRYAKGEAARTRIANEAVQSDRASVLAGIEALMTTDLRPRLSSITVPTTVIHAHDPAMGRSAGDMSAFYAAQYENLTGVRHVTVGDSFHFIMDDQPDAFHAALATALAQEN